MLIKVSFVNRQMCTLIRGAKNLSKGIIMRNLMKTRLNTAIAAAFLIGSATISIAKAESVDDAKAIGTSDTPQIKRQDQRIDKKQSAKNMKKHDMSNKDNQMKMMDTNNDGMVSKDEYMTFHEETYNNMKPGEGGISYKSSMNNKPIGTTTGVSKNGSVDVTKEGPINGTTTGTNN
jgi:hypothetical protein